MDFTASVKAKATEYGADVSSLAVGLAIEAYKDARNYPYDDEDRVLRDMQANINKIAMAAVEIDAKDGMEGQLNHSENGITRGFSNSILAYRDVIAIAHTA